jgi:voltage-gated potassium channel
MTQARWRSITEWPLTVAAVVFLAAYATEVIGDLHGASAIALNTVINVTWIAFIIDYLVLLALAQQRGRWFSRHLLDLAIIALPILRPLRLLRLITLLRVLQRAAGSAVRGRVILYVAASTALLVFTAALAELDTERGAPGANIETFGDALWWAWVTITTVGYGDLYPVTAVGRLIAVAVMLGGIALIGVVTATIASWIIERVSSRDAQRDDAARTASRTQVDELAGEIRVLRAELAARDDVTP